MDLRIGHGYDMHRLVPGRSLWLGGILIPHDRGLEGHSDADVLIHAICDALLGAMASGDLGQHFPDNDEKYRDADSKDLLREVVAMMSKAGWQLINLDATLLMQKPKIASFIPAMRDSIAGIMETPIDNISVKATTTEGLGPEGRAEGISATAVVLISKQR